jgi:hypothetical protein
MGESKMPQAGRGAFANRRFYDGDIISLSPMMHIAERSLGQPTVKNTYSGSGVAVSSSITVCIAMASVLDLDGGP